MNRLSSLLRLVACVCLVALVAPPASAFCGFYVSSADTRLFNRASQVVLVRDGNRTVMTMGNDYKGAARDFAMVVPVPTMLRREQIHVAERSVLDRIDAFTAPRLVEYQDNDPCMVYDTMAEAAAAPRATASADLGRQRREANALGVRIEARYSVGEYDILMLSARDSGGLVTWLTQNGYRLPPGAAPTVASYLRQGMRFFVAKVNLAAQSAGGYSRLRPLQIAYEHPRFMLPIRLGTVNADGPQELFVYGITRRGRIETSNYRTVALPTDVELPPFVEAEFADFYRAMFTRQTNQHRGEVVFLEYAWDLGSCDPCAAEPLSPTELRELGVFWLGGERDDAPFRPLGGAAPIFPGGSSDAFVTRLHVRYDAAHFPEDLHLKVTANRQNFQGRYVLRQPFLGAANCPAAEQYFAEVLPRRREAELTALARLTGWSVSQLRRKLPALPETTRRSRPRADSGAVRPPRAQPRPAQPARAEAWWERLWPAD